MGCFFNTLFFSIAFSSLFLAWMLRPTCLNPKWLLFGGLIGVVVYTAISVLSLAEQTGRKIVSKLVLGTSFAAVVLGILTQGEDLGYMIVEKTNAIMAIYLIVLTALMVKRGLEFSRTCEACEYKMRWSQCPGFGDIVCDLVEHGFVRPKARPQKAT